MAKRIVFTGGSGKAGRHVALPAGPGYEVLNRPSTARASACTLIADVTDAGQVFGALTSHLNMAGFETRGRRPPDAVPRSRAT
jgi:UDP-glucose 4-epimerase